MMACVMLIIKYSIYATSDIMASKQGNEMWQAFRRTEFAVNIMQTKYFLERVFEENNMQKTIL